MQGVRSRIQHLPSTVGSCVKSQSAADGLVGFLM
jgi:hypothetical protein